MYPKRSLFISLFLLIIFFGWTFLCLAGNQTLDKEIIDAAHEYVVANSAPGIKYKLRIAKKVENWALVDIIPLQKDLDQALVILEKVEDKWIGRELTTDTSILKDYPKLSK